MKTLKKIWLYVLLFLMGLGTVLFYIVFPYLKNRKQTNLMNLIFKGKEIDNEIKDINKQIQETKNAKTSKKKLANNSRSNNIKSIKSMLSRVKR